MSSLPEVCQFKKRVGIAQCRGYIRDPDKQPDVFSGEAWRNCKSCKFTIKPKEATK